LIVVVLAPLLVSIVARTYGWIIVLGDRGVVNNLLIALGVIRTPIHIMYTRTAIVIGLVHVFLPFMVLSVLSTLDRINPSLPEAAVTLGAGPMAIFARIILPLITPGLAAGMVIVFSLSISSYVTPALMGGPNAGVLATLVYQEFAVVYRWHVGAALVGVLLGSSLLILSVILYVSKRMTRAWAPI
jgi:putative spermidine/putrescine transport system permease protein